MSVEVRLRNAEMRAEKPLRELKEAQRAYEEAVRATDEVKQVARSLGIPAFGVFRVDLNVVEPAMFNGEPAAHFLAKKAGVFISEVDLQRCYVGEDTLLEGIYEVENED